MGSSTVVHSNEHRKEGKITNKNFIELIDHHLCSKFIEGNANKYDVTRIESCSTPDPTFHQGSQKRIQLSKVSRTYKKV